MLAILKRRYARGEISKEEYEGRSNTLRIRLWRRALTLLAAAMLIAASAGCQGSNLSSVADDPTPAQPYAGLQEREIRALAPERVGDLLAGHGAGYALAAEMNRYPGPTHVLELWSQLELTKEQQDAVSSIKAAMQQEAVGLGAQLVDLEEELDHAFRTGAITPRELSSFTDQIADVEGKLRDVHLQAHLQMVEVLTEAQVARYDELRGYVSSEEDRSSSSNEHEFHSLQH